MTLYDVAQGMNKEIQPYRFYAQRDNESSTRIQGSDLWYSDKLIALTIADILADDWKIKMRG